MKAFSFIAALLLPFALLFCIFYKVYPSLAESAQTFENIIIENVAKSGYNKSSELTLFWLLACTAVLLTLAILYINRPVFSLKTKDWSHRIPYFSGVILFPFPAHFLLFGQSSSVCLAGIVCFLILFIYCKNETRSFSHYLLVPVLIYYSLLAFLTCAVRFSSFFALSSNTIYGITAVVTLLILIIRRLLQTNLQRLILLLQLPIPFLLMLFLVDRYLYQGKTIRIPYAPFYYFFYCTILVCFMYLLVIHVKRHWKDAADLGISTLVHYTTAITIFVYTSWSACPMYAQPDQHHHGEQMIPWQQIVLLGQRPYEEYTPVSGLFPMVNGFIQNVLLDGTVSDYSPAITLTMTLFCVLTMYLICRHAGGAYGLLTGIFFALPSYNRQYMVLPILLLLFLPELLKKPELWTRVWIFSCFLAGLYYPLYGGAVLLGTTPLGIYMFLRMLRETHWKTALRRPSFYLGWAVCLVPILLCIPLLLRMAAHTLTYSGQTILADGISIYGQDVPDFFLPYMAGKAEKIRLWLYYGFRFFLPMLPFVTSSGLILLAAKDRTHSSAPKGIAEKKYLLFGLAAVMISLGISYTYTLVRADTGMILSRTAPILISVMGIFLPLLLFTYGKKLLPRSICILVTGLCFSLPLMLYHNVSAMKFPDMWVYPNGEASLIMDDSDKLFSCYEVPETFLSMEEINLSDRSMLGRGFMVADQVGYLQQYESVIKKCSQAAPDTCYMGFDGQGFYYYLNAKACYTGFIQAGKSYEAQQAVLEQAQVKRPVIFLIEPQSNYYVYYWMMTSDYVYSNTDKAFYPLELYEKLYPYKTSGDDYRSFCTSTDFGLVSSSFGNSMDTLMPLFGAEINIPISMNEPVIGSDYDFLYLSLKNTVPADAEILEITFLCDGQSFSGASVTCLIGDGRLLIPLGMNPDWLLSKNSHIRLSLRNEEGKVLTTVALQQVSDLADDCRLLQLNK